MRDSIKNAVQTPYFQLAVSIGIQSLLGAAQTLSSVGIDITGNVADTLRKIHSQLTDAAYEVTDLDELLRQAQDIGRDKVVAQKKSSVPSQRPQGDTTPTESGD